MKSISRSVSALAGLALTLSLPLFASAYDSNTRYYAQPSCTIRISNQSPGSQGYDRTVTLSWTSTNAERVSISGIGSVGQNGAMAVSYPKISSSYTMTVSNSYTSATCSTEGSYSQQTYDPYNQNQYQQYDPYRYVTLEQIPYTGIDFGALGNTIYGLIFAAFLVSIGYLAVYLRGMRLMK